MSEIVIASQAIRQMDGLYCLNDLHRASGSRARHKPSEWLRLVQVTDLISELKKEQGKAGIPALIKNQSVIKTNRGGNNPGTYACRELVYAYATWISPAFFLKVLRTFDAVVSGAPPGRPALLPLRAPRSYEEACALAEETAHEVNTLSMRLVKVEPWLRYWRDAFIEDALSGQRRH